MALNKICYLCFLLILCLIVMASSSSYGNDSNTPRSIDKEFLPQVFSVQGIVYCKSGHKFFPLKGSVARITCLGIDKYGYETVPFSILTRPSDSNGYFLAKLSTQTLENDGYKISQCKAFLHNSPPRSNCQFTTNANNGMSGAPLFAYRPVGSNGMRLYSVGPFVYNSELQSITPTGY